MMNIVGNTLVSSLRTSLRSASNLSWEPGLGRERGLLWLWGRSPFFSFSAIEGGRTSRESIGEQEISTVLYTLRNLILNAERGSGVSEHRYEPWMEYRVNTFCRGVLKILSMCIHKLQSPTMMTSPCLEHTFWVWQAVGKRPVPRPYIGVSALPHMIYVWPCPALQWLPLRHVACRRKKFDWQRFAPESP